MGVQMYLWNVSVSEAVSRTPPAHIHCVVTPLLKNASSVLTAIRLQLGFLWSTRYLKQ